jgi:hypothetical protein
MVRRVRCTVRYSSYSTSCSDWYEEFGVLHLTVHIPPVVLTGMQSCLSEGSIQAQCNPTQGTKLLTTGPLTNNHERYCGLWNSYHIGCLSRTIKSKKSQTDRHVIWQWYSAFVAVTITFYIASTFLPYSSVTFYQFFWLWGCLSRTIKSKKSQRQVRQQ